MAVKLINADELLKVIRDDQLNLDIHTDSKSKYVHHCEYNHFAKRIIEAPDAVDFYELLGRILFRLSAEKKEELLGMYNYPAERMLDELKMEVINDTIDECIDIVKKEFEVVL